MVKDSEVVSNSKSEDYYIMVIKSAMNMPGVRINRGDYLRTALKNHVKPEVIEQAIRNNPASAGIPLKTIDKIAKAAIRTETTRVTAISAAAGVPGGFAMAGTLPADLVQYFGHVIRILQKQVYLYGWKEMYNTDEGFDDETMVQLTLFLGVMFGVHAAGGAIGQIVKVAAPKIEKDIAARALTKGVVYPVVKKVATRLGFKMTKQAFARGVSKAVPIIGAVTSGGVTYATFKPLSSRLQNYLNKLPIADPDFYKDIDNYEFDESEIIDVGIEED